MLSNIYDYFSVAFQSKLVDAFRPVVESAMPTVRNQASFALLESCAIPSLSGLPIELKEDGRMRLSRPPFPCRAIGLSVIPL